jgi:predicted nucleic acid-binding protein
MIVVSDTTPIISLVKVGQLDVLRKMYGVVVIPAAVYHELVTNKAFPDEAETIRNCEFIQQKSVRNELAVKILESNANLDKGESEAIVLVEDLNADLLLVDERKARAVAKEMGITITGTLGVLIEARRLGYVPELRPLLEMLIASNIRISNTLFNEIVKLDNAPDSENKE